MLFNLPWDPPALNIRDWDWECDSLLDLPRVAEAVRLLSVTQTLGPRLLEPALKVEDEPEPEESNMCSRLLARFILLRPSRSIL